MANMLDEDWNRLLRKIEDGTCVPFLGAGACSGIIPLGAKLAKNWAVEYGYSQEESRGDLIKVSQFLAVSKLLRAEALSVCCCFGF